MKRVPLGPMDWLPIIAFFAILAVGLLNRAGVIDISDHGYAIEEQTHSSGEAFLVPCMSQSGPLKGAGVFDKDYLLRPRI